MDLDIIQRSAENICAKFFAYTSEYGDNSAAGAVSGTTNYQRKIFVICGPTAAGKSVLALAIAKRILRMFSHDVSATIINADAMQVYAELPIITCQPDVQAIQSIIPHKLYGYINAKEEINLNSPKDEKKRYSVVTWLKDAIREIDYAIDHSSIPIVVGGTGMYINSLIYGIAEIPHVDQAVTSALYDAAQNNGLTQLYKELAMYDPITASCISCNDMLRIIRALSVLYATGKSMSYWKAHHHKIFYPRNAIYVCYISPQRSELYQQIDKRVADLFSQGCYEEFVQYCNILRGVLSTKKCASLVTADIQQYFPKAIGLKEMFAHYTGIDDIQTTIGKIQQATRRYAKKQFILFNKRKKDYDTLLGIASDMIKP